MLARLSAFALALIGLAALRAQFDALSGLAPTPERIWAMAGSFSILTTALLVLHLLAITKGWQISATRAAGLLVSVGGVGIIAPVLPSIPLANKGLGWWANLGLHTALPLGFALWWLAFAPKAVSWSVTPGWLIWPLLYGGYALTRGALTGLWPCAFLDADTLGWPQVACNLTALLLAFGLLSLAVAALARGLQSAKPD